MPFLERISTVTVSGSVLEAKGFTTERRGDCLDVRIADDRTGQMYKVNVSYDELEEAGIDVALIKRGYPVRIVAEDVPARGDRDGFLSIKTLQWGRVSARVNGHERPARVPVGAAAEPDQIDLDDTPF